MSSRTQPDLFAAGHASVRDINLSSGFRPQAADREAMPPVATDVAGMDEDEALARLLACCSPECAAPAWTAKALLARFGCWPRVMGATRADLAAVAGERVAADLGLVRDLLLRGLEFEVRKRSVLSSWAAVSAYLRASLAGAARESFRVLFLDKVNQLIADELMGQGTVDHAPVYPREIMRRALELNASACCLVHNHPSGNATPSSADIEMTRLVVAAGKTVNIAVHDHFLVGGDQVVSFKGLGLM